jgi:hypothetical protein
VGFKKTFRLPVYSPVSVGAASFSMDDYRYVCRDGPQYDHESYCS